MSKRLDYKKEEIKKLKNYVKSAIIIVEPKKGGRILMEALNKIRKAIDVTLSSACAVIFAGE